MQNKKIKEFEKNLEKYKNRLDTSKQKVKVLEDVLYEEKKEMHHALNMFEMYSDFLIEEHKKLNETVDCEIELEDESVFIEEELDDVA